MEHRRHFLTLGFAVAIGAAAFAAGAQAAPLLPTPLAQGQALQRGQAAEPAVVAQDEVDHLKPEQVYWHRWHHGIIGTTGIVTGKAATPSAGARREPAWFPPLRFCKAAASARSVRRQVQRAGKIIWPEKRASIR